MGLILRILVMVLGLGLMIRVIFGIKKSKLSEWQSMLWLVCAVVLILLGAIPSIVNWLAGLFGITWPPALIFLVAIVIIAMICFSHAQEISVMRAEISEQEMQIALLKHQMEQMQKKMDELNGENTDEHSGLR